MPAFDVLQNKRTELIRKGLEGSVFAGGPDAPVLDETELFDPETGELIAFPEGYADIGYVTSDGAQWSRSVDTSDIDSWGSTENTRSDKTSDVTTLQLACQETNAQTISQYMGVNATDLKPAPNGSLMVKKPTLGTAAYRRVFAIAVDLDDGGEIYIIRCLPRAKVTDYDDSPFANGDDPILWPVTYTGYRDSEVGTSDFFIFGGPGWKALQNTMGFEPATTG